MTFEELAVCIDGLQAVYQSADDIEMGLRSLVPHGFTLAQMERMAALRGFEKIASVARRLIREDKAKEPTHAPAAE